MRNFNDPKNQLTRCAQNVTRLATQRDFARGGKISQGETTQGKTTQSDLGRTGFRAKRPDTISQLPFLQTETVTKRLTITIAN
ncbi:hypothetical protein DPMN_025988 [Dreissena polymorpha]|uniref:Uncharacterized protein n=1 Tax=Dreissena polymorpha TaxID=45954 RepID=A0A9D4RDU1_DREPO|nr:hypothetical protein DPMN_025988 [Dreissena polymorpha]